MAKETISKEQLIALIKSEAAHDPLCEDLGDVKLFGTEEGSGGNWTVAFTGIGSDRAAGKAMSGILRRLSAAYDVAWHTRH